MLKISRLADYAVRILYLLADHTDGWLSATEVANSTHLKLPTTTKVMKLLHEAGILKSERGVNGGYQLAKPAEEIGMVQVISAIDGKPAMTQCSNGDAICEHDKTCELRQHWRLINAAILNVLGQLSVADLRQPHRLRALTQPQSNTCSCRCHHVEEIHGK